MTDLTELGAAWRRAEAALPEGWHNGPTLTLNLFGYDVLDGGRSYIANVQMPHQRYQRRVFISGDGDTPTAALIALAERLEALR